MRFGPDGSRRLLGFTGPHAGPVPFHELLPLPLLLASRYHLKSMSRFSRTPKDPLSHGQTWTSPSFAGHADPVCFTIQTPECHVFVFSSYHCGCCSIETSDEKELCVVCVISGFILFVTRLSHTHTKKNKKKL